MNTIDMYDERGSIIGKMILEEEMENKLFKVKIGSDEEFAIQFTGKGKNIREIEKFTKPIFKKFKISKDDGYFYIGIEYYTHEDCPVLGNSRHHLAEPNDWIVFFKSEPLSIQTEVRVVPDEVFKKHYEVVF